MYLDDCSRTAPNNSIAAEQFRIIHTWVRNKAYCLQIIEKRESAKTELSFFALCSTVNRFLMQDARKWQLCAVHISQSILNIFHIEKY